MARLDQDVLEEWITADETGKLLESLNITMRIIQWVGPGGGHPYIEFFGAREDLQRLWDHAFTNMGDSKDWIRD